MSNTQNLIFSIDQDAFWALLKEAFKKAISEMPTDFVQVKAADAND